MSSFASGILCQLAEVIYRAQTPQNPKSIRYVMACWKLRSANNVCCKIIRCTSLNPHIRRLRPTYGGKCSFFRPFDNNRNDRGSEQIFEIGIDPHGLLLVALQRIGSRL